MPEYLEKLRPDRDLQVYFERPSASAAMSGATAACFTVSGTWRQQFDWCVIEWNRDNVFEHPLFRNLPDGDLSGLQLSYEETRENCIPMDSDLYPTVDWPNLRVWALDAAGVERFYKVPLPYTAVEGAFVAATATFTLQGSVAAGDVVGLAWINEHYAHSCGAADTLTSAADSIAAQVNANSATMTAAVNGAAITLTCKTAGANGNRIGAYALVTAGSAASWDVPWQYFAGGASPTRWRVVLDFSALKDKENVPVPMNRVRKMRWTYSADFQRGEFQRSEFAVHVTNWTVTGAGKRYRVAGPGSRRVECSSDQVEYFGTNWSADERGNYSGGSIRWTDHYSDGIRIPYRSGQAHELLLGTRLLSEAAEIALRVDDEAPRVFSLRANGEDRLMRIPLGSYGPGEHTVYVTHNGPSGWRFWFDFLEIAVPAEGVEDQPPMYQITAATDWDTDHSLALPAERTAWMLHSLGFRGRVNHYVGALVFYELWRKGHVYASAHIDFSGTPVMSSYTDITLGDAGDPNATLVVRHLNLAGDTAATIAKAFELEFNRGYTGIRAEASGTRLTISARRMGSVGEAITLVAATGGGFQAVVSSAHLAGSAEGAWTTDTIAPALINRACRDWSREFYRACKGYGWEVTAAFSTEVEHGDASVEAGIAQRYSDGQPCLLTTPALQTNFSPTARSYWERVHTQMADILVEVGQPPFLQLGEVQWWYFPGPHAISTGVSLPYYDTYTRETFEQRYGFPMRLVAHPYVDPALFPEEAEHLPRLIGEYCDALMAYVKAAHPDCRFEVLYPTDVNDTPWGRLVNYPAGSWTPEKLAFLKTESFSFTFARDLNKAQYSVQYPQSKGFPRHRSAFLVGPGDSTTAWLKEVALAREENVESIVLFALDQFCLIGYPLPLFDRSRRSARHG